MNHPFNCYPLKTHHTIKVTSNIQYWTNGILTWKHRCILDFVEYVAVTDNKYNITNTLICWKWERILPFSNQYCTYTAIFYMHIKDNNLCLLYYSSTQTSYKKVQISQDKITSKLQNVYLNFFLTFQTNVISLNGKHKAGCSESEK